MKKPVILLLVLLLSGPLFSKSTKGKTFWVGFMENLSLTMNGPPAFNLHISSDVNTTCTVSVPFTGFTTSFALTAGQVVVYTLPAGNFHPMGDEATANNGVMVTAGDSIEVKAMHCRVYFSESTIVLPLEELGTDYMVMAQDDPRDQGASEFVVVATQNNTTVEITPSAVTLGTRPIGVPFKVTLQQGQMYQLQSMDDLTGSSVKSLDPLKKIAVFAGCLRAIVGCNLGADDHIYDQVLPKKIFSKSYNIVPFSGHLFDVIKVLALQNSTTYTVSGIGSFTLQQGQFNTFTVNASCDINASASIAVSQLATSQGCNGTGTISSNNPGDPGMINLIPSELTLKKTTFYTLPSLKLGGISSRFPLHRVNVVIKTSAIGNLKLDNTVVPTNSFNPVAPGSGYSYVRFVLDTLTLLQHTLTCDSGFNATIYSLPDYNFYGHHLGYNKPEAPVNLAGIAKNTKPANLSVFPNPAEHILHIRSDIAIHSVGVVNLMGEQVLTIPDPNSVSLDLDLGSLAPGIYYCTIRTNKDAETQTFKFIRSGNK